MIQYLVSGRVVPESTDVSYTSGGLRPFSTTQFSGNYEINCLHSRFLLHINFDANVENVSFRLAHDFSKLLLGNMFTAISFAICAYYHVILDHIQELWSDKYYFPAVSEPIFTLYQENTAFRRTPDHDIIIDKAHDYRVARVKRLATLAIELPFDTPILCRLAIETVIRELIIIENGNDRRRKIKLTSDKWAAKLKMLGIDENNVLIVKTAADELRHGALVESAWETRKSVLECTWEVIHKFEQFISTAAPAQ